MESVVLIMNIKRKIALVFVMLIVSMTFLTACDDGKDYTCGYCGTEMGHYYDYIDGEYTCYSCSKALRD